MLVAARSLALLPEASVALAFSRRRWGLAVTCACVVRHCACVLAPPMGAITSGGLHVIGRIAPDQLGLNLPDRVFRLIGNKRRLGAGRPCPGPVSVGDAVRTLAAPRLTRARAAGSRRRLLTGVYRHPAGQSCTSEGA